MAPPPSSEIVRSDAPTLTRRAPLRNLEAGWSPERKRGVDPRCVIVAIALSLFGELGNDMRSKERARFGSGTPRVQSARQETPHLVIRNPTLRANQLGFATARSDSLRGC